jgi:hypothetical protein
LVRKLLPSGDTAYWGLGERTLADARDGPRFTLETRSTIRIAGEMLAKGLDGYEAIDARVSGFVDLAHPTRAKQVDDFVRAEPCSRRKRHRFGGWIAADSATKTFDGM